jgi:hypothetical protein
MKRSFSCLHSRYQMFDPIKGALIGDHGRQALVMLDLAVEFDALGTHRNPVQIVKRSNPYWSPDLKTIESKDCSLKNLWPAAIECSEGALEELRPCSATPAEGRQDDVAGAATR